MRKKLLLIAGIAVIILSIMFISFKTQKKMFEVCIKEDCFFVEVANSTQDRRIGLMNREFLELDEGMLFVFEEEGVYPFWMKNTLIPLDIIWISKDFEVVYVQQNAQPCKSDVCKSYNPRKDALYVLEINPNIVEVEVGDKIIID